MGKSGSCSVLVKPCSGCTLTGIAINIAMKYDDINEHPLINLVLLCQYLPIKSIIHTLICKIEDYSAEIKENDY